jgi:hypothetical protein
MIPRFSDAMALHRVGGGPNTEAEFEADLNENWTIGPKVHGGVMVALCAKAARVAMLGSRTNLLLSLPMLTSMAMYQTLFG